MMESLSLQADDRVLIVLPHPDDETLATGGLIQRALAAGAALRIVIATDGDLNPWPQRWIERRWRIDADARHRWGARRREEARTALAIVGVAQASVCHLGWPDGGLTAALMRDDTVCERLATEVAAFEPTLVVAPVFSDRHPDHSALRVIVEIALSRSAFSRCRRLGYIVHGEVLAGGALTISLSAEQQALKEHALDAHQTQMCLSAERLRKIAKRTECFETNPPCETIDRGGVTVAMNWPTLKRWRCRHDLLLLAEMDDGWVRQRIALSRYGRHALATESTIGAGLRLDATVEGDRLQVAVTASKQVRRVFLKIERIDPRLLIYDADGWHQVAVEGPA